MPAPRPEPRAPEPAFDAKPQPAPRPAPRSVPPAPASPSSIPAPAQGSPLRAGSQTPPPPRQPVPETVDVAAGRAILAEVRRERPDLASVLGHASPLAVGPELLELAYDPKSFLAERAREEAAVALLEKLARAHFGAETR